MSTRPVQVATDVRATAAEKASQSRSVHETHLLGHVPLRECAYASDKTLAGDHAPSPLSFRVFYFYALAVARNLNANSVAYNNTRRSWWAHLTGITTRSSHPMFLLGL